MRLLLGLDVAAGHSSCRGSAERLKAVVNRGWSSDSAFRCRGRLLIIRTTAKERSDLRGAATGELSHLAAWTKDFARAGVDDVLVVRILGFSLGGLLWLRSLSRSRSRNGIRSWDSRGSGIVRGGQLADGGILWQLGELNVPRSDMNILLFEEQDELLFGKDNVVCLGQAAEVVGPVFRVRVLAVKIGVGCE